MPFALPDSANMTVTPVGVTDLNRSLSGPGFDPSTNTTFLGADISADPPFGLIGTDVSAHFPCGTTMQHSRPPRSASLLVITVNGSAGISAFAWALGGFSQAYADLSITILEWEPRIQGGRWQKGQKLLRAIPFNPVTIVNFVVPITGLEASAPGNISPFLAIASMPVSTNRLYSFIVTVSQTATCQSVTGFADAVSNVTYAFPPPFFQFI